MPADYHHALAVAIMAGKKAAELLRKEFHQTGGPKGAPGKAPVDTEAEKVIRNRLQKAYPKWGYCGEETGEQAGTDPEKHVWLVDPNDGTICFQNGYRGAAVSIGLLRDGRPVLGVVYAFAAPDDAGDLLAWAESCGPLLRNGKPVEREPWPARLDPQNVVLISHTAESKPEANAEALAPARFRAIPSIAYRLALAAAGDGAAAVSLNSPGGWDYAAGHALLLAAGGELVNQRGEPVTYWASGQSQTTYCFGGAPEVVAELPKRNWKKLLQAPAEEEVEYDLVFPAPDRHVADAGLLARGQGCLLGQLAGDALGGQVEFQYAAEISASHPDGLRQLSDGGHWNTLAGQPTDDSELALLLARSIVQAGEYDPEAAAQAYFFWYNSKPFDIGMTISRALVGVTKGKVAAKAAAAAMRQSADPASQANGSLMRISPLGIWGHSLPPDRLAEHAQADAELTHPSPVCRDAAAIFTVAIGHAISSGEGPKDVYACARDWAKAHCRQPSLLSALEEAAKKPPADYSKTEGWVVIAFQNAFYQLANAPSLEEGVVRTVMAGGDTDTNAAIAGALLGAVYGRSAIPSQWQRMVLSCRPMEGLSHVRHARPRACWPVDALHLAERLLCLKPS